LANLHPRKKHAFILVGDIRHAGKIRVVASSLKLALKKAGDGDFSVEDETNKCLAFEWNGDKDSIEKVGASEE
jgi:hypothetical protein